ncbi:hypothetical protein GLOTRDRAFT_133874 [Gloeophyllum trabeum ATCC 11539]|uniref:Uncharacterized protein n=1 Tax=Gloeophyllum trabeum (strain ATCC 11539 / FP-39264 / Madison 617) TaxID=670483 RepID=S7PRS6_GLOTA|nr:uncharacterized protein GLOTRDRAFT_133874 [Gloeophyllum trabeum ATCC 11539]EPQ50501.1 hypothetical protein GLOTRDRAFT_133874 [Gloeophyllum trabeum ATCC 11539]
MRKEQPVLDRANSDGAAVCVLRSFANSPPLSSSPTSAASRAATNALGRALSIASKKLFGGNGLPTSRTSQDYSPSTSSPRRQEIITARSPDDGGVRDPLEEIILSHFDDLVQKDGCSDQSNTDLEADNNAITGIAAYMLVMSFSQKGIDQLRNHQEYVKMRDPDEETLVSEGFLEGGRQPVSVVSGHVAHLHFPQF